MKEIERELEEFREEVGELWEERVEKEFLRLVRKYRVRPEDALAFLRKKYLSRRLRIEGLSPGRFRGTLKVKAVEVTKKGFGGIFGDETGMIPFKSELKVPVSEGESAEISNFQVRLLNGVPAIFLDGRSKIRRCAEVCFRNPELKISELFRRKVNFRIRLSGYITSIQEISQKDSRFSFILDDGSASILSVASGKIACELAGIPLKSSEEELRKRVLGSFISAEGTLVSSSEEFLKIERAVRVSSIPLRILEEFFEVLSDERAGNEDILQRAYERRAPER
ncbi:MAG: hypothetical protein H5T47_07025 [Archaeoglobi archaeon]|nr:hypothetical protein [Candidatus Mnemosynella bozhongmuii]